MRTNLCLIVVLSVVTGACASSGKKPVAKVPDPKLVAAIEESPQEQEVRRRAEEIKAREDRNRALKEVVKNDTPEMKIAREQLQKEADRAEARRREQGKLWARAQVSGCSSPEDARSVVIVRDTSSGAYWAHIKLRIINTEQFPLTSIGDEAGPIVQNLCPGGSATIYYSISGWADDRDYITVTFNATGVFPEGGAGIARSNQYQIRSSDIRNGRREQSDTWLVRLSKNR